MSELRVERKENMAGGKGHVIIKHILEDKELNGKCKMYAEVTLSRDVLLDIMSITTRVRHIISFVGREIMMTMDVSAR